MKFLRGRGRLILRLLVIPGVVAGLAAVAMVLYADRAASKAAEGKLFDQVDDVPETEVGLVFGCNKEFHGRENLYFKYRIEAAAALWKAGKVKCLLVSGDNHSRDYDEPQDMKNALVKAGVPEEKIVCDYAGFRTLDTVVRAKKVFGVEKAVLISQEFHNERAAYLAKSVGLEFVGLNAQAVGGPSAKANARREKLARVKMWLDVNVLGTEPKFLGPKEKLPL